MKAKELMIGDLVRVSREGYFKKGTIVKVRGIDADNVFTEKSLKGSATCMAVNDPGRFTCGVWCDYLAPLPLTDEILKANGFEYFHKNFAALDRESPFQLEMVEWPDENGIGLWMLGGVIKIRYVHELQHAFRLAGIDKEIKLKEG